MKRLTATLTVVIGVLIFGFAASSALGATSSAHQGAAQSAAPNQTTWTGNGSENLPCTGGTLHWIFTGGDQGSYADIYINGVLADDGDQAGPTPGNGAWHFYTPSTGVSDDPLTNVYVVYDGTQGGVLTISHCVSGSTTSTVPTTTTSTTSTVPTTTTSTTSTAPTTTTSTTSTVPTTTTSTAPTTTTLSTMPTESTRPSSSTTTSVLPSASNRPSGVVPTAIDAGVEGPSNSSGQSTVTSAIGVLGGLALASAGAFALMRRRGQHEA